MLLAALLGLAAAAPGPRDAVPIATPVGKPVDCVPLSAIGESIVRDDRTIDFRASGGRYYRNVLPAACPGLGFERRFSYATSIGQLCSVDVITVLQDAPVMRGATCGLGPFQPVALAH